MSRCYIQVRQWAREIQLEAIKDLVEWSHDLNMGPGTYVTYTLYTGILVWLYNMLLLSFIQVYVGLYDKLYIPYIQVYINVYIYIYLYLYLYMWIYVYWHRKSTARCEKGTPR